MFSTPSISRSSIEHKPLSKEHPSKDSIVWGKLQQEPSPLQVASTIAKINTEVGNHACITSFQRIISLSKTFSFATSRMGHQFESVKPLSCIMHCHIINHAYNPTHKTYLPEDTNLVWPFPLKIKVYLTTSLKAQTHLASLKAQILLAYPEAQTLFVYSKCHRT